LSKKTNLVNRSIFMSPASPDQAVSVGMIPR
jgi:hypothetical protein